MAERILKTNPSQKGGKMDTRRLVADLPVDLYKAVKVRSVELEIDLKDLVAEALRRYLGQKGGESSKK
jgi:hypothetical protein